MLLFNGVPDDSQLRRQEELTRRIQGKRTKAVKRSKGKLVEIKSKGNVA